MAVKKAAVKKAAVKKTVVEKAAMGKIQWGAVTLVVVGGLAIAAIGGVATVQLWPEYELATSATAAEPTSIDVDAVGLSVALNPGAVVNLMVILLGVIGGTLAGVRTAANWAGDAAFGNRWLLWYLARPFLGGLVSLVLYLATTGGLLSVSSTTESLNPFGIAGLALMAGLFSKKAFAKLSEIFDVLFSTAKERVEFDAIEVRLEKLQALKDSGALTDDEFAAAKKEVL